MRRPIVLLATIAALTPALPAGAAQAATCGDFGAAGAYDVFTSGDYTVPGNVQEQGRVAVGGNARVATSSGGYSVGTALGDDAARVDLFVAGSLTVGANGAQAPHGSVTYGTTLSGTIGTPKGTLKQATPPAGFFPDAFTDLRALSGHLSRQNANGTHGSVQYGRLVLQGVAGATRNVFSISAEKLQTAQVIEFKVAAGSTTIVNVTGATYNAGTYPTATITGAPATTLLWNFQLATRVRIGATNGGLHWLGSVLAPEAAVEVVNGQLSGQAFAASVTAEGVQFNRATFAGCLPPAPTRDLILTPRCRNPVSDVTKLQLTNTGSKDVAVTWSDLDSAQTGAFTARAESETYFGVLDGSVRHRIVVTSPTETAQATTSTADCAGTIVVSKAVTGDGTPPAGPWSIVVEGDSGYRGVANVNAGESVSFDVPGDYQVGTADLGQVAGGFNYTISEPDPRGAVATVSQDPVTIFDGQREAVVVGNAYTKPVEPVEPPDGGTGGAGGEGGGGDLTPPLPEPGEPVVQPPQPTLPPGAPEPAPGPGLVVAESTAGAADLAVRVRVSPPRIPVGGIESAVVRVTNRGSVPAADAVVRELPQADPKHPNRTVRIISVSAPGATCQGSRPVSCRLGTVTPGEVITIRARGRILVAGSLKSVVQVASPTPDSNTTNNISADGVVAVPATPPLSVAVRSPRVVRAGDAVRYRVSVTAPRAGVAAVRLCHRPRSGLLALGVSGGARRVGGRLCLDISRLAAGHTRAFTVRAVASQQAAGRSVLLPATAVSPARQRPAAGASRTRIVGAEPSGLG